jgi:hypothetical protein
MLFRRKHRESPSNIDIQRLKQEIRSELARIHGGPPLDEPFEVYDEPAVAPPVPHAMPATEAPREPEAAHVPTPEALPPLVDAEGRIEAGFVRTRVVSSSPLIQRAALGQMRRDPAPATNGSGHTAESPYGAFRNLAERFESAAMRLEVQVRKLVEVNTLLANAQTAQTYEPPAPVQEPRFPAGDTAVRVTLAAVPSFLALMDIQHALDGLAISSGAQVTEFGDGDASLLLTLGRRATLSEIMEGLRQASSFPLLVEESRPEAARLRLRFIPEPPQRQNVLDPALWAKA